MDNLAYRLARMRGGPRNNNNNNNNNNNSHNSNASFQERMEEHREEVLDILDEIVEILKQNYYDPIQIQNVLTVLHGIVGNEEPEEDMYNVLPPQIRNLAEDIYGYWYLLQPVGGSSEVQRIIEEYRDNLTPQNDPSNEPSNPNNSSSNNGNNPSNTSTVYSNVGNFLEEGGKRKKRKTRKTKKTKKTKKSKSKKTKRSKKH